MTAKAANEARERLLGLLAEQHRLGLNAASEERYVAISVEILKLAKVADLSPVLLAPPPPPPSAFPIHTPVPFTAEGIAQAKARLEEIETRQEGRWLDHARALRGEIELAENMTRP